MDWCNSVLIFFFLYQKICKDQYPYRWALQWAVFGRGPECGMGNVSWLKGPQILADVEVHSLLCGLDIYSSKWGVGAGALIVLHVST